MKLVWKQSWKAFLSFAAFGLTIGFLQSCTCNENDQSGLKSGEQKSDKKVFTHLRTSAHKSLDPMKQFDQASAQVVSNVYDTLLTYHYLKRPYELEPLLLKSMPEKQDDGLTYVFKLKEGVMFHDDEAFPNGKGRELTADDAIYSIKRFADANVNHLSYVLLEGFVEGLDEFRASTREKGAKVNYDEIDVPGLKKIDKYTFSVQFTRENPLALYPFAFTGMSIVPREAVEKYGDNFADNPVGTGPFYMKTYSRRGTMVLAKNENYHQTYPTEGPEEAKQAGLLDAAGKKLPFVDELRLPLIEEPQPAMLKFKRGELDWIGMNKDEFNNMAYRDEQGKFHLKKEFEDKFDIDVVPMLSTWYMKFNMRDPLVGENKALRQAIAYALNTEGFIDLMINGRGIPLETIVPVDIAGSQRTVGDFWYDYNIEMAKKKLAEAGFPNGKGLPELAIEYRATSKDVRQFFEYIRNDLAKVGIKVRGNFQTFSNFLKKTESGNYQIADAGWGADYPDAENFYQLLYSENRAPGPNDGNFSNERYDELYRKIKYMENGPERFEMFKELNEIIKDEVPLIIRYNPLYFNLLQTDVRNFKRNMMREFGYKYIDIAE
jgi:ABC-type transport system substrate-binding protein